MSETAATLTFSRDAKCFSVIQDAKFTVFQSMPKLERRFEHGISIPPLAGIMQEKSVTATHSEADLKADKKTEKLRPLRAITLGSSNFVAMHSRHRIDM